MLQESASASTFLTETQQPVHSNPLRILPSNPTTVTDHLDDVSLPSSINFSCPSLGSISGLDFEGDLDSDSNLELDLHSDSSTDSILTFNSDSKSVRKGKQRKERTKASKEQPHRSSHNSDSAPELSASETLVNSEVGSHSGSDTGNIGSDSDTDKDKDSDSDSDSDTHSDISNSFSNDRVAGAELGDITYQAVNSPSSCTAVAVSKQKSNNRSNRSRNNDSPTSSRNLQELNQVHSHNPCPGPIYSSRLSSNISVSTNNPVAFVVTDISDCQGSQPKITDLDQKVIGHSDKKNHTKENNNNKKDPDKRVRSRSRSKGSSSKTKIVTSKGATAVFENASDERRRSRKRKNSSTGIPQAQKAADIISQPGVKMAQHLSDHHPNWDQKADGDAGDSDISVPNPKRFTTRSRQSKSTSSSTSSSNSASNDSNDDNNNKLLITKQQALYHLIGLPHDRLAVFDWEGLEERYHQLVQRKANEENKLKTEFELLSKFLDTWLEASTERDKSRGHKRLKTRILHVQHSEEQCESRRLHYTRVVGAFKDAFKLLGGEE